MTILENNKEKDENVGYDSLYIKYDEAIKELKATSSRIIKISFTYIESVDLKASRVILKECPRLKSAKIEADEVFLFSCKNITKQMMQDFKAPYVKAIDCKHIPDGEYEYGRLVVC